MMPLYLNTDFVMGLVIALLVGPVLGSFLGMAVPRYQSGRSWGNRSKCDYCGETLSLLSLIPILSFFVSRGKTNCCGQKLSWGYPMTEIASLCMALICGALYGATASFFLLLLINTLLLFQIRLDLEKGILSPEATLMLCLCALVFICLPLIGRIGAWNILVTAYGRNQLLFLLLDHVGAALILYGIGLFLYHIYSGLRGLEMIGGGDVKFLPAAGLFLGMPEAFLYLVTVSLCHLIFVAVMRLGRGFNPEAFQKNEAPMGPALAVMLFVWIIGRDLFNGAPTILLSFPQLSL